MTGKLAAAVAALAMFGLGACGGASNEFVAKATEMCMKDASNGGAAKCGCQVKMLDAKLTDKEKKLMILGANASASGSNPSAADGMKMMTDAGLTLQDMMAMGTKMMSLQPEIEKACGV